MVHFERIGFLELSCCQSSSTLICPAIRKTGGSLQAGRWDATIIGGNSRKHANTHSTPSIPRVRLQDGQRKAEGFGCVTRHQKAGLPERLSGGCSLARGRTGGATHRFAGQRPALHQRTSGRLGRPQGAGNRWPRSCSLPFFTCKLHADVAECSHSRRAAVVSSDGRRGVQVLWLDKFPR